MRTCHCGRLCTTPGIPVAVSSPSGACGISIWERTAIACQSRVPSATSLLSETHPGTTSWVIMAVAVAEVEVWHLPSWPKAEARSFSASSICLHSFREWAGSWYAKDSPQAHRPLRVTQASSHVQVHEVWSSQPLTISTLHHQFISAVFWFADSDTSGGWNPLNASLASEWAGMLGAGLVNITLSPLLPFLWRKWEQGFLHK